MHKLPEVLRAGPEHRVRPDVATFEDLKAAYEYEKEHQPGLAVQLGMLAIELHDYQQDHPGATLGDLLSKE